MKTSESQVPLQALPRRAAHSAIRLRTCVNAASSAQHGGRAKSSGRASAASKYCYSTPIIPVPRLPPAPAASPASPSHSAPCLCAGSVVGCLLRAHNPLRLVRLLPLPRNLQRRTRDNGSVLLPPCVHSYSMQRRCLWLHCIGYRAASSLLRCALRQAQADWPPTYSPSAHPPTFTRPLPRP